ncbi:wax ester synthase/diacylglycerol acyltransferase 11-like [Cryptomeria japonica]|uniref:wax ester synthase/diacylglycerol acyltransferase 11-like n=1 Tax=Cryptomeria japonica TaxID=3369 RepID=UPI0027DAA882|nr:wax ester synthase/diacylglycerol acyltransferase 11-like [Cryptomeria japonica]
MTLEGKKKRVPRDAKHFLKARNERKNTKSGNNMEKGLQVEWRDLALVDHDLAGCEARHIGVTRFLQSSMEANLVNGGEPLSPIGQLLCTSPMSLCVQVIFELEQPIDVFGMKKAIQDILLPSNPRFCCTMSEDSLGVLRWVKTEVNVDDHVIVPKFPPGQTEYDEFVNDYICKIHLTPLPKNRPLWQFHFLNNNTSKARATMIINIHHSLGDGISLMSLVCCCLTRAEDPSLPLTFPSSKSLPHKPYSSRFSVKFMYYMLQRLFVLVLVLWYTVSDFISSLLRMMCMNDSKIPIRGPPGVEMLPKVMTHVTFPIEDIRKIKTSIGGTVNDVIMGVIFYGFQRYLQITHSHGGNSKEMKKSRVTGLVAINTRVLSLKDIKEMMKSESEAPWGNRFGLLHIPMPTGNAESPLDFVRKAKKILDRKKMSHEVSLTTRLIGYLGRQVCRFIAFKPWTSPV